MRTPISYYGGKQQLASKILAKIPEHQIYVEPFLGGGAVFFAKAPSPLEVINDINSLLITFYRVSQQAFEALEKEITATLHSRTLHQDAKTIYDNPHLFPPLKQAWAVWVLASMSFGGKLDGSYGYDRTGSTDLKIRNKRRAFTKDLALRLQQVDIECTDALRIIKSRDTEATFVYADPPYIGSDQGHYDGYSEADFEALLQVLSTMKGKFLLSSYPSALLEAYRAKGAWHQERLEMSLPMSAHAKKPRKKIEVLTWNY